MKIELEILLLWKLSYEVSSMSSSYLGRKVEDYWGLSVILKLWFIGSLMLWILIPCLA